MIEIKTSVLIPNKSPEKLFNFLLSLDKNQYINASPICHKDFKIVKPNQHITGSVYYFHEKVGRLDLSHYWLITNVKKNELIVQKAEMFYPVTIELHFRKVNKGTEFTQSILIGFKFFGLERIIDWLVSLFILTPLKIQTFHNHTKEEFANWGKMA